MSLFSYYRVSKPSADKLAAEEVPARYKKLRNRTFWGVTAAYCFYYLCRLSLSVIKQPLIDGGVFSAGQLGVIGSCFFFVYAVGKFLSGFIADYCNIRRYMATGLLISAVVNLLMGLFGVLSGTGAVVSIALFFAFAILWSINGVAQSMGASPGVISLSRWFPKDRRGTFYSIFSSTPYLGESLSFLTVGALVAAVGWQWGFFLSAAFGLIGGGIILVFVCDTPESVGLPKVQEIAGETLSKEDTLKTITLQKMVLRHPGVWVIALSAAFVYVTKYAVAGWGVLFLQKAKGFSLENATQIIAFSTFFAVLGTVASGWLSDTVFKGDRVKPAIVAGLLSTLSLSLFLFGRETSLGYVLNIIYVAVFSLSTGVLYCIVAGLMALDMVPRKATGAAVGIVGISSYIAAGIQDLSSGYLIEGFTVGSGPEAAYNFTPVSIFWISASILAFVLPVLNWKKMKSRMV